MRLNPALLLDHGSKGTHTHISSSSELNITYWYSIHTHDTHTATVLEKSVKCAMVLYKPHYFLFTKKLVASENFCNIINFYQPLFSDRFTFLHLCLFPNQFTFNCIINHNNTTQGKQNKHKKF